MLDQEPTRAVAAPILPGATIGILGGGQLGRMFVIAAKRLGYDCVVFCQDPDEPAAQMTRHVIAPFDDDHAIESFARGCNVITLEFENIPASMISKCAQYAPVYPESRVLAITQDRLQEKSTLRNAGLAVTPFAEVHNEQSLVAVARELSWPMIVKTATSGYDGKGQYRVESAADAMLVPWGSHDRWIAEQLVHFNCEVSVIVARTVSGKHECFPVFENEHRRHILDTTIVPARILDDLAEQARRMAITAAETLGIVGLLCVEMFVAGDQVMINEVAPRPHNSGHVTMEACHTCQFEQHVRSVCNLPLGSTQLISGGAAMGNLLGDLWSDEGTPPNWHEALAVPGVRLHLYGKHSARPKRKMGHLSAVAESTVTARDLIDQARSRLQPVSVSSR